MTFPKAILHPYLEDASSDPQPWIIDRLTKTAIVILGKGESMNARQWNLQCNFASALGMNVPPKAMAVTYELMCRYAAGVGDIPAPDALKTSVQQAYAALAEVEL